MKGKKMKTAVLIKGSSGITQVPIESQHMSKRRLFITGEINEEIALDFMKQVMYLNDEDKHKPITVFINSPGGDVDSGMLIHDVIVSSQAPIYMYCVGTAYSMGAVLFSCAKRRYMLPNSKLMLHQPLLTGKVGGNVDSMRSISEKLCKTKDWLNRILALHTGKTVQEVDQATAFDHYFTAQEAVEFGLADGIKSFGEVMEECR